MLRMVLAFLLVLVLALGAAWLADQPGRVVLEMAGYEIATSLFVAALALLVFAGLVVLIWLTYHWIVEAPGMVGSFFRNRKRRRGFDALSRGMVAAASGDAVTAARETTIAGRELGNTPLALLLRAQTAQLAGNEDEARRIFEEMVEHPDTQSLGLRGLFMLARSDGDSANARAYAERAAALGPQVPWASLALFELQSAEGEWSGALKTLETRRRFRLIERQRANRLAAVLRTARALENEDGDSAAALDDALEAHRLDPNFVPAAALAARLLAEKGEAGRAARIVERTWRANPHPDLAAVYGHVRTGDSARERLTRARSLASRAPGSVESAIAVARAALEAREFAQARTALTDAPADQPSQRVCLLMAEIEHAENGDRGRVREWLTRAVSAPRDPAWTADGFVSPTWRAVSPVSGRLDAFEWRVPVEGPLPELEGNTLASSGDTQEVASGTPMIETGKIGPLPESDGEAVEEGENSPPPSSDNKAARPPATRSNGPDGPAAAQTSAPLASSTDSNKDDTEKEAGQAAPTVQHQPDDPGVANDADEDLPQVHGSDVAVSDKVR